MIVIIMYGSGLRLMECLRLRVKDIDFLLNQIIVRDGKGNKDRITMLPQVVNISLKEHLKRVSKIFQQDLQDGYGRVNLPYALSRKYPNASREWSWQYIFPATKRFKNPITGEQGRHHIHETAIQKSVKKAIRTVQELLGHKDVRTTMIYTHVLNRGVRGVMSPADRLK